MRICRVANGKESREKEEHNLTMGGNCEDHAGNSRRKKNHIRNSPLCSFLLFSTLARSLSLLLLCDALHTAITINIAWTVYVRVCKCASVRYFYNVSRIKSNGDFLFRVFPTFQTATAAALLFVFHISISISASLRFGCLLLLWHNSFAR